METLTVRRQLHLEHTRLERMTRLERIRRDRAHIDVPLEADFSDQAVQRENDEVLERLEDACLRELGQIEHALAHLDRGGANRCECCGLAITDKRLTVMPQATLCSQCAGKLKIAAFEGNHLPR
ncbi:MAG: TraR/DksA family transcriptional regulator [Panacagrimonas sp.]